MITGQTVFLIICSAADTAIRKYLQNSFPFSITRSTYINDAISRPQSGRKRTRRPVRVRRKSTLIDRETAHGPVPRYPTAKTRTIRSCSFPCPDNEDEAQVTGPCAAQRRNGLQDRAHGPVPRALIKYPIFCPTGEPINSRTENQWNKKHRRGETGCKVNGGAGGYA